MGYRLSLAAEPFLANYWQREHLFIPGGFAGFIPPGDADELAGLAMEDGVDARIVYADGAGWHQQRGPFTAQQFQREGAWSLLVQSVDHFWDEAAELRHGVPWLPIWRLDDVMMSYASDGGSAGPHYDNYDVFIIQGEGRRRWEIGQFCDASTALQEHSELRLLANFESRASYELGPGDVLYIPPGCAHNGVSLGESTSFSIGFRAPRVSDLLARWVDHRLEDLDGDWLLHDPAREPASSPGEITNRDLNRTRAQLRDALESDDPRWFGEVLTQSGHHHDATEPLPLPADGYLLRRSGSPVAWHLGDTLLVFASGESYRCPAELANLAQAIAADQPVDIRDAQSVHDQAADLIAWLASVDAVEFHGL